MSFEIRFCREGTWPKYIEMEIPSEGEVRKYIPERTCRDVHEPPKNTAFWPAPHFKCSECGTAHVSIDYVFYCPNCGARITEEDE